MQSAIFFTVMLCIFMLSSYSINSNFVVNSSLWFSAYLGQVWFWCFDLSSTAHFAYHHLANLTDILTSKSFFGMWMGFFPTMPSPQYHAMTLCSRMHSRRHDYFKGRWTLVLDVLASKAKSFYPNLQVGKFMGMLHSVNSLVVTRNMWQILIS